MNLLGRICQGIVIAKKMKRIGMPTGKSITYSYTQKV
jgi:hypothetical protein